MIWIPRLTEVCGNDLVERKDYRKLVIEMIPETWTGRVNKGEQAVCGGQEPMISHLAGLEWVCTPAQTALNQSAHTHWSALFTAHCPLGEENN
uniref:Uncharacterized protein n=1 Tax=Setaria digitata TaxID=48799 RepID=A0A915PSV1_9BILA